MGVGEKWNKAIYGPEERNDIEGRIEMHLWGKLFFLPCGFVSL